MEDRQIPEKQGLTKEEIEKRKQKARENARSYAKKQNALGFTAFTCWIPKECKEEFKALAKKRKREKLAERAL